MHSGLKKKILKIEFALFKIFLKSSVAYTYLKIAYRFFGFLPTICNDISSATTRIV